ncbi:cache domain-containing sensor histidine kinase [Paenibacillus sp. JDR-2]|uniref:cache domain-containing sensor histidine kinase n=1 Tax=Paenibacillus sp. (strain JDR-2) TaxID=324057 RepID=UPI000166A467|nr:sensor histidine kinase [Paenibacillus sp. JDR-2]ACT00679.1 histidine kinase [Paenibacillus sp. JDR-2]
MFAFATSINRKLMALLLAVTIIPITVSMIISNYYIKDKVTQQSIHENQNLLALGKNNILGYMDKINENSLDVYLNINKSNSLYALIERGQSPNVNVPMFDEKNNLQIYAHMLNIYQSTNGIHQIQLQIGDGKLTYLMARGFFRRGINQPLEWPTEHGSSPKPFVEATHTSAHYNLDWSHAVKEESVFTLRRPIIRTPSDEVIGYLSMDVKSDELNQICRQLTMSSEEQLYIIDRSRNFVCSVNGQEDQDRLKWTDQVLASKQENGVIKWQDQSFSGIVIYDTLSTNYMDWVVVKQLPYSYLYESATAIRTINTSVIAIFMVLAVIASFLVSYQFTKPIKRLIGHINQVQSGNFNVVVPVDRKDEIGILARRFNTMIQTIRDLINSEYRLEIANKTNQLRAMQAQINPHFLYNALQSIGTLALHAGAPKVYTLITSIAKMMRYNMNTSESIVPFSMELNHAKAYLELQQQRFNEQLTVHYDIDPASLSVQVPKMLLQPLVENYFKHGYETSGRSGVLRLFSEVTDDGSWLTIRIEDNGSGMDPDKLRELRQLLFRSTGALLEEQKSIGISNVWMRLKLYYNEEAEMSIDSSPSGGFTVTLRIPVQELEERA